MREHPHGGEPHNPVTAVPETVPDMLPDRSSGIPVSDGIEPTPAHPPNRILAGPRAEKPVALALQGGGAHGAFTWGVLDALIEDGRLAFEALTGASAGAMNAVVMVDGWLKGGPDGAREGLERFWREVSLDGDLGPAQRNVVSGLFSLWKGNPVAEFWSKMLSPSPYVSNPLNINPLRKALAAQVDFERLRESETAGLFVSATNVWTGKLAVFERERLTVDHLMASACLPTVFQAVQIDGVPYWDGGYLGNPPLYPLHRGARTRDIVLVQINPVERRETPRTEREIRDRLNEITFNANLMRELRAIDFLDGLIEDGTLGQGGYQRVLVHRIDGTDALEDYNAASKLDARWTVFKRLRDKGRGAARAWLAETYGTIGHACTLNLRDAYQ
ncbi:MULTISPECIES: patatin-like phospholipase family protein [unclassified Methylobacterium]|uniref:patatin-like phospholipase family protein n=1 Tax=unclassified Methylobacterium TaxID=2615210 RepID=UPI0011C1FDB1|nr:MULTISPECIES: patatin-like phospholipase family protein [unclassified Methylobacterium]QEE41889.1 patatin-like phospholipase family protein [Methylobacterium sp. WL1]TXM98820.1 patatin-like phospholipase family protein [Methylobacterium sp. WL64]TXN53896.1 patatin-like phospholipase family protein [Methylobacterium sp. WL2]